MNRRTFMGSFAGMALSHLMMKNEAMGQTSKIIHHPPKAKRVVQLFMAGAASHVDTFDYKPALKKLHGKPWDPGEDKVELFQSTPGA